MTRSYRTIQQEIAELEERARQCEEEITQLRRKYQAELAESMDIRLDINALDQRHSHPSGMARLSKKYKVGGTP